MPDPDSVTVIHVAELVPVHAHADAAVTPIVPDPPAAPSESVPGVTVAVQSMPACVAVNVRPAIVAVPVRDAVVVLAERLKAADPLPELDAPSVIAIHAALVCAVHVQPAGAVTAVDPLDALESNV